MRIGKEQSALAQFTPNFIHIHQEYGLFQTNYIYLRFQYYIDLQFHNKVFLR